jgi:hypothetical protein
MSEWTPERLREMGYDGPHWFGGTGSKGAQAMSDVNILHREERLPFAILGEQVGVTPDATPPWAADSLPGRVSAAMAERGYPLTRDGYLKFQRDGGA